MNLHVFTRQQTNAEKKKLFFSPEKKEKGSSPVVKRVNNQISHEIVTYAPKPKSLKPASLAQQRYILINTACSFYIYSIIKWQWKSLWRLKHGQIIFQSVSVHNRHIFTHHSTFSGETSPAGLQPDKIKALSLEES